MAKTMGKNENVMLLLVAASVILLFFSFADSVLAITGGYDPIITIETVPSISDVFDNPDPVGYGYDVTINATITDENNISSAWVELTYPNSTSINRTMSNVSSDYEYVTNNLWNLGTHNYIIYANDTTGKVNTSSGSFDLSAEGSLSVKTEKNTYGVGKEVNLTQGGS